MGVPGEMGLEGAEEWKSALNEAEFRLYTVFAAFPGESYADVAAVRGTVGFVPQATREEREKRMLAVSDFAMELGVGSIAAHLGFLDEDWAAMRDLTRRVCDYAARRGQTFALETGQEPAEELRAFVEDVGRGNLRINFDPANMILYGSGDPVEALGVLGRYVISAHGKDGDWPETPGSFGRERVLGEGAVGMERFVAKLREIGFSGPIAVEREGSEGRERLKEMEQGVTLLRRIAS